MASVHLTDGRIAWALIALGCGLTMLVWQYFSGSKNVVKKPYAAPGDKSI
jgi:hypothetical protein